MPNRPFPALLRAIWWSIRCWLLMARPAILPAAPDSNLKQAPPKLSQAQILEKLRALGAGVWMKNRMGEVIEIKRTLRSLARNISFSRVEFRPQIADDKPLVAAITPSSIRSRTCRNSP